MTASDTRRLRLDHRSRPNSPVTTCLNSTTMHNILLQERVCPVCGSRDRSRLLAESNFRPEALNGLTFASRKTPEYMHWKLSLCKRCDLAYADPAPSPEALWALYEQSDFDSAIEARYASATYARFLPSILRRLPDKKLAVDIGTGEGTFLTELVAAGFDEVMGIEPSSAPIAAADPAVRPLIRQDVFRENTLASESASLVTCFQTIEHLDDPLGFCKDAWRALKPGGALFLIGHNRRAVSALIMGRKSPIYDIEHLQLFSRQSMRSLVQAAGFTQVSVMAIWNRYPISYWARLAPFPAAAKTRLLDTLRSSALGCLALALPAGNLATVCFKTCTD